MGLLDYLGKGMNRARNAVGDFYDRISGKGEERLGRRIEGLETEMKSYQVREKEYGQTMVGLEDEKGKLERQVTELEGQVREADISLQREVEKSREAMERLRRQIDKNKTLVEKYGGLAKKAAHLETELVDRGYLVKGFLAGQIYGDEWSKLRRMVNAGLIEENGVLREALVKGDDRARGLLIENRNYLMENLLLRHGLDKVPALVVRDGRVIYSTEKMQNMSRFAGLALERNLATIPAYENQIGTEKKFSVGYPFGEMTFVPVKDKEGKKLFVGYLVPENAHGKEGVFSRGGRRAARRLINLLKRPEVETNEN